MNRIFSLGLAAAVTALLSQPIYAEWRGGGGGHVASGGGGVHFSAPAVHVAPSFRAPSVSHFTTQARPQYYSPSVSHFTTQVRPQYYSPSIAARSRPATTFAPSVTRGNSFIQPQRSAPSVAFGGSAGGYRGGGNTLAIRPPGDVAHGWDRGHIHTWNHHHYRWWNGNWVIYDDGYYGYPYGDSDYDQPYVYSPSPAYSYDDSSGNSMVADVQNQLTSLGYVTGPADGEIGPLTQNALANFQRDHNLPITGQIDNLTLRALGLL